MIQAIFGPQFQTLTGDWLRFESPAAVHSTCEVSAVKDVIRSAEAAARANNWVAIMLSYEAAPAFDSAFKVYPSHNFPLVWAAVFPTLCRKDAGEKGESQKISDWQPAITQAQYARGVDEIRSRIAEGDTYQVNYTFPLITSFNGDSRAWFQRLCHAQRAAYSAYLDLGRHQVLSLSPELFFARRGDRVTTRPMKGTIRRGRWLEEDEQLADQLVHSAKDRAENVMIVDLLRNDLGRLAVPGSVVVASLFDIEHYETLFQMTSTVNAVMRPKTGLVELLSALFPCGSITGAPKIRTMEIIRELETCARSVYTGAIGLLQSGGDCAFNVAIRTVLIDSETKQATFGVGGGVTFDSTADSEYNECLLKAGFLNHDGPPFMLLESILLQDGEFFLLDSHLERMRLSALYFDFAWNEQRVLSKLAEIKAKHQSGEWKIRLLSTRDAGVEAEAIALTNSPGVMKVAFAKQPSNSGDRFLFHKTTNRALYERELAGRVDCDDVVFWNERGEVTESVVANVVMKVDGGLVTPPQSCGLLAGTFRNKLIAEGKLHEQVITKEELRNAREFFLINSVRKWTPAILVW